ncbi:MAG: CBS domain-containing protein [bacterium]
MKVEAILTVKGTDVYTVDSQCSVQDAVKTLDDKNVGAVVVLNDENAVCGIFSERDVVRQVSKNGASTLSDKVADVMSCNVISCQKEDELDAILSLMTEKRIRHLPVIENEQLSGLISIGDVVKRKIESAVEEAAMLRDYIAT